MHRLSEVVLATSGVVADVRLDRGLLVPGEAFLVDVTLWNGGSWDIEGAAPQLELPDGWTATPTEESALGPPASPFFRPQIPGTSADGRVAAEIRGALLHSGFFQVIGHGIPADLIEAAFRESRRFHARPLEEKLALDGVRADRFILKDNLGNIRKGRLRAVRAQVGYKLPHLLADRADLDVAATETLFGDDSETDAVIYAVYAEVVAGRLGAAEVERLLKRSRAYPDAIETFYDRLTPGGYLLLGHSESLLNVSTAFELVHLDRDLVYRRALESAEDGTEK